MPVPKQSPTLPFQPGGDEREAFGGFAGRPLAPVEAMHQVAGDAVLLQLHGDGNIGNPSSFKNSLCFPVAVWTAF